ncbi:hypothetical protein RQP46_003088 [Phenoliferia psychrophenolica]
MDLDQDSNNQIFGSTSNAASTSASAADAALLTNWHSAEPREPLEPLQGYEPLEAHQPTDFFSNLYDLTYDINPNANQAADSYSWLFNFSPSAGVPDVGGYQVSPAAPSPSTPKDHAASLSTHVYDNLTRLLSRIVDNPDHLAFTHATLQSSFTSYFASFNAQLPILHSPLFEISTADPHLLLSILAIGAWFSPDREVCQQWQKVASSLVGLVVMSDEFVDPEASISLLQTLILLEMHGMLMSDRKSHTKSAILHSSYVNIARRTKIFLPKATPAQDPSSADSVWRAAMLDETGRRAFELRLDLPIPDSEWQAKNGEAWQALRFDPARRPPPPFADSLKQSLMPGGLTFASSAFATTVIMHGLMSIGHDIVARDNVLLGMDSEERGGDRWLGVLSKALDHFKSRLEASCSARFGEQLLWSATSLGCVAHIVLVSDLLDLQVFAGSPTIVRKHASELGAASEASWYSIAFLKSYILRRLEIGPENSVPGGVGDTPHLKWCLFVAALCLWSFGFGHTAPPFNIESSDEIPTYMLESDWYIAEALAYADQMTFRTPAELNDAEDAVKMRTSGVFIFILSELQDGRSWELEREACDILKRLVLTSAV